MSERLNPQSALIYLMVVISAADRKMSDIELRTIGSIVQMMPVFRGFDTDALVPTAQACAKILADAQGLEAVLSRARDALPEHLRETAFALVTEVAVADGRTGPEEMRLLHLIRQSLHISPLAAAAIEHSAYVRHREA